MVELLSFCMGAVSAVAAIKLSKVIYRVYPYMLSPSFLAKKGYKQCVIIAGATDGIGQQYARHLSQHFKVIAIGRNPTKLESLRQISSNVLTHKIDFSQDCLQVSQIQSSLSSIMQLHDQEGGFKIRGIINCVGVANFCPFSSMPIEQMANINRTNIQSLLYLLKILHSLKSNQQLAQNPFFINLSSGAANYPNKYSSIYSGTKSYLSNLMQVLAKQDPSIAYLDLKPWFVKTKMVGYMNTWDTVLPQQVIEGSLRLLGRRAVGNGTWKHELIEEFRHICLRIIEKRTEQQEARLEKMKALRSQRNNKKPQ